MLLFWCITGCILANTRPDQLHWSDRRHRDCYNSVMQDYSYLVTYFLCRSFWLMFWRPVTLVPL